MNWMEMNGKRSIMSVAVETIAMAEAFHRDATTHRIARIGTMRSDLGVNYLVQNIAVRLRCLGRIVNNLRTNCYYLGYEKLL